MEHSSLHYLWMAKGSCVFHHLKWMLGISFLALPSFEVDARNKLLGYDIVFDPFSLACLKISKHDLEKCETLHFVHGKCWLCHIHLLV